MATTTGPCLQPPRTGTDTGTGTDTRTGTDTGTATDTGTGTGTETGTTGQGLADASTPSEAERRARIVKKLERMLPGDVVARLRKTADPEPKNE